MVVSSRAWPIGLSLRLGSLAAIANPVPGSRLVRPMPRPSVSSSVPATAAEKSIFRDLGWIKGGGSITRVNRDVSATSGTFKATARPSMSASCPLTSRTGGRDFSRGLGRQLAREDPDRRRPRRVHRDPELGAEVDDLALRRVDREPVRQDRNLGRQLARDQPGRVVREQLERGGAFEDHASAAIKLDLGQPPVEAKDLAHLHVAARRVGVVGRPEAVLGVDQPGDVPQSGFDRSASFQAPLSERESGRREQAPGQRQPADPESRPERPDRRRVGGGPLEPAQGRRRGALGPGREPQLGVDLPVFGEVGPRRFVRRQQALQLLKRRLVEQVRAIFVHQLTKPVRNPLGYRAFGPVHVDKPPGSSDLRTQSKSARRILLSELWMLCDDRPHSLATSGTRDSSP